jgi:uncharacterized protein
MSTSSVAAGLPLNVLVVVVQGAGGYIVIAAGQMMLMALVAPALTVGIAAGVLLYGRGRRPWMEAAGAWP